MRSRPDIRLLAVDLDGTLLRADHSVSARNRAAISACLDRSVHVALVTGRFHAATAHLLDLWPGRPIWITTGNGANTYPPGGGPLLRERLVDLPVAREVLTWAEAEGVYARAYVGDRLFVYRVTELTRRFQARHGVEVVEQVNLGAHLETPPLKILMVEKGERLAEMERVLRARWGDLVEITASTPTVLEVGAKGATKGDALRELADHLGVAREQVAAIGNERNDLSMITWAGRGAAVGNAGSYVLEVAPQVVASNEEDGVAEFIESWLGK